MFNLKSFAAASAAALFASAAVAGGHGVMVGGGEMLKDKTIVENAVAAPELSTLVAAVQAAGLVETLSSEGPFTVFTPTNDAFDALPDGTVASLLEEENKGALTTILTCHVVGAEVMSSALLDLIEAGGGSAAVETVGGCMLTAAFDGTVVTITDENGGVATVTAVDAASSNGVIHAIDAVILPAS